MELIFQETPIQYLKQIVNETVHLEQTADIVVSDSMPDIDRVVDAFGTAMIRTAQCSTSGIGVDGIVQAGVLFVGENGKVQPIAAQIPFSVRKDVSQQGTLQCKCTLRSVDARALNSRKLLVRVGISCELKVYAQAEHICYDIAEPAPNLQLKRMELPLNMPLAVGEKSFVLNEELELPADQPAVERLLKCVYRTQLAEQKVEGDKAVFKGALHLHVLYEDENERLVSSQWDVPFSQYAQLGQEQEEAELSTHLSLAGAEIETDMQNQSRRLLVSVNLMAHCTAFGQKKLTVIEDAFCTDAELTPEVTPCRMEGILDRQVLRENLTASSDTPAKSVVDACMYFEEMQLQRMDDKLHLELPVNCNVLYYDEQGLLQGKTLRSGVASQIALAENGGCRIVQIEGGEIFCAAGSSGLELRAPMALTVECSAEHSLNMLCGGEIGELAKDDGRRPSVILRRTDNEEELWQIAKTYRTSVQTIMEANELQEAQIAAGAMLLIPM